MGEEIEGEGEGTIAEEKVDDEEDDDDDDGFTTAVERDVMEDLHSEQKEMMQPFPARGGARAGQGLEGGHARLH